MKPVICPRRRTCAATEDRHGALSDVQSRPKADPYSALLSKGRLESHQDRQIAGQLAREKGGDAEVADDIYRGMRGLPPRSPTAGGLPNATAARLPTAAMSHGLGGGRPGEPPSSAPCSVAARRSDAPGGGGTACRSWHAHLPAPSRTGNDAPTGRRLGRECGCGKPWQLSPAPGKRRSRIRALHVGTATPTSISGAVRSSDPTIYGRGTARFSRLGTHPHPCWPGEKHTARIVSRRHCRCHHSTLRAP